MSKIFFSVLLLFFYAFCGYSQVPADPNAEEDSIVIIEEEPVIVNTPFTIEYSKISKWYVDVYAAASYNNDYFKPCENCLEYFNLFEKSYKANINYSAGADLVFASGNLLGIIGAEYTVNRNMLDFVNYNEVNYELWNRNTILDLKAGAGYWISRHGKKISVIVSASFVYGKVLSIKGNTIDYNDTSTVIPFADANAYRSVQYSASFNAKILFRPLKRIKFFAEPYYTHGFSDLMQNRYPYLQQKRLYGCRAGFFYSL